MLDLGMKGGKKIKTENNCLLNCISGGRKNWHESGTGQCLN